MSDLMLAAGAITPEVTVVPGGWAILALLILGSLTLFAAAFIPERDMAKLEFMTVFIPWIFELP